MSAHHSPWKGDTSPGWCVHENCIILLKFNDLRAEKQKHGPSCEAFLPDSRKWMLRDAVTPLWRQILFMKQLLSVRARPGRFTWGEFWPSSNIKSDSTPLTAIKTLIFPVWHVTCTSSRRDYTGKSNHPKPKCMKRSYYYRN